MSSSAEPNNPMWKVKVFILTFILASFSSLGYGAESFEEYWKLAETCQSEPPGISILPSTGDRPTICLNGTIDRAELSDDIPGIEERFGAGKVRSILIVSSGGGDVATAISIAEALGDFDIVVREKCLSACAGYLFLAATKKVILRDSDVGWHSGEDRTRASFEEFWDINRDRILSFFGDSISEAELKEKTWREISQTNARAKRLLDSPNSKAMEVIYWYPKALQCAPALAQLKLLPHFWRPSLRELDEIFEVKFVSAESPEDFNDPMVVEWSEPVMQWRLDSACVYKDWP